MGVGASTVGTRGVCAAPGLASVQGSLRWTARELAPAAIVLLQAAPCLASGTWRLPKPCRHNAIPARHCANSRIAQRIPDMDRCGPGLLRCVLDPVRPVAGYFASEAANPAPDYGTSGSTWPFRGRNRHLPVRLW